jgi:hypothetical protein
MNSLREVSLIFLKTAIITIAVVLGFVIGDALGVPVWLQGFFLLPAGLLFFRLTGERFPSFLRLIGFLVLLSAFVLLVHLSSRFVPERYLCAYYLLLATIFPLGPISRWCERRLSRKDCKSEQSLPNT